MNKLGAIPVLLAGHDDMKRQICTGITDGTHRMSYCLTEPESGSDAAAQEVADFIHLPGARLDASVREASAAEPSPLHAITLEQRDDHASIMVRRTESSPPELHEEFDDLYIVHEGAAVLVYGGTYEGGEMTQAGEWRGGYGTTSSWRCYGENELGLTIHSTESAIRELAHAPVISGKYAARA